MRHCLFEIIEPASEGNRISRAYDYVTMVSSFVGIAIVALPSGMITAEYMAEIQKEK